MSQRPLQTQPDANNEDHGHPELTVVLVNHNGADCLPDALASLRDNTSARNSECIVVDSGSDDDSWRDVESFWHAARVMRFDENIGFCRGCNRGAEASRSEFVAFVNFDSRVEPGWDTPLIMALQRQDVSVAGGLLTSEDGLTVEASGLAIAPNMATFGLNEGIERSELGERQMSVVAASGALMMMRREEFLRLGGFYEPIWMYGEEADLCLRVPGRVVIDPRSATRHEIGHAAGPPRSEIRLYWPSRNRLINAARHLTTGKMILSVLYSAAFDLLTLAQLRSWSALKAVAGGWRDGLSLMGSERSARTPVERKRASEKLVSIRQAIRQQHRLGRL